MKLALSTVLMIAVLSGCSQTLPKKSLDNICSIYYYADDWKEAAFDSYERWGTPPSVLLSIVYQESSFNSDARPEREYLLGFIPWFRPTSAYGYAQATDATWYDYQKSTGRWRAQRNAIDDALDFIGWYNHRSHQRLGIKKTDAYNLYLAYHEGQGGYKRGTHKKKPWLLNTAKTVAQRASRYRQQYQKCR